MNQEFINWVVAAFGGLVGFLLHAVWGAVKDLQDADKELTQKVASVEVLVAGDYVRKSELSELQKSLSNQLDRIENKLDKKVDK